MGQAQDSLGHRQQRASVSEIVERSCFYQAFQVVLLQAAHIRNAAHLLEGLKRPFFLASLKDRHNGAGAHSFDRRHSEYDDGRTVLLFCNREISPAGVDVRQFDRNVHSLAVHDRADGALWIAHVGVEQGHHVLRRIVGLQVRRPVGD